MSPRDETVTPITLMIFLNPKLKYFEQKKIVLKRRKSLEQMRHQVFLTLNFRKEFVRNPSHTLTPKNLSLSV